MQPSFLLLAQHKKRLRCEQFLEEMEQVIPWRAFCALVEPYYATKATGRNKMDLLLMLKIYFLQQWYHLSDPAAEEALYDRVSFQKFLGIDLLSHPVPDESTILHFRHLLERHGLQTQFFDTVQRMLAERGLLMKEGTIVDATIIAAPTSTKNKTKKRDPEMSQVKKGNEWYFGMKAHIGVDARSGLVHTLETSTAKVHDRRKFGELLHGEEQIIFGDKGYTNQEDKHQKRKEGIVWAISDRGHRHQALSSTQKKRNQKYNSIRAKVEHPFRIVKCQWGYVKVRYKGLLKNSLQLATLFALANLYRVRNTLLTTA